VHALVMRRSSLAETRTRRYHVVAIRPARSTHTFWQYRRITPPITRRPARLLKHEKQRVGGRVHWLVRRRHYVIETRSAQPSSLASCAADRGTKARPARQAQPFSFVRLDLHPPIQIQIPLPAAERPASAASAHSTCMRGTLWRESAACHCYVAL
jgi:hypothetical protein